MTFLWKFYVIFVPERHFCGVSLDNKKRAKTSSIGTAESERTQQPKQVKLAAGSMLVAAVVG
jgi:hypothetical protein